MSIVNLFLSHLCVILTITVIIGIMAIMAIMAIMLKRNQIVYI